MQAAESSALRTLISLPNALLWAVFRRVRPRDMNSVALTCRRLFNFVNSPELIDTYVREHAPLTPTLPPPTSPLIRRPSAVTRPELMRARSLTLQPYESRHCCIAALQAAELLGARPTRLTPISRGEFVGPMDGCTVATTMPNRAPVITARHNPADRSVESLVFVLPEDMGYNALALGALKFPPAEASEPRVFNLYRVEDSLVGICASGGEAWLYLIVPRRYGFHGIADNTLTPHVLARVPLTAHEMKPINWAGKPRAVLAWGDGVPELWAIADAR